MGRRIVQNEARRYSPQAEDASADPDLALIINNENFGQSLSL
jgi:hypothetical protein